MTGTLKGLQLDTCYFAFVAYTNTSPAANCLWCNVREEDRSLEELSKLFNVEESTDKRPMATIQSKTCKMWQSTSPSQLSGQCNNKYIDPASSSERGVLVYRGHDTFRKTHAAELLLVPTGCNRFDELKKEWLTFAISFEKQKKRPFEQFESHVGGTRSSQGAGHWHVVSDLQICYQRLLQRIIFEAMLLWICFYARASIYDMVTQLDERTCRVHTLFFAFQVFVTIKPTLIPPKLFPCENHYRFRQKNLQGTRAESS